MCIIKTGDNGTNMHLQSESDEQPKPGGMCPWQILSKTVHSEPQYLPRNYTFVWVGGTWGKKDLHIFFVIDYEYSIIDHHNNLIINQLSVLADDWPITNWNCIGFS